MDMGASFNDGQTPSKTPVSKEPEESFKEWVVQSDTGKQDIYEIGSKDKDKNAYPSLVVAASSYSRQQFKNFRYPWEAFADVGFRCAISLGSEN
jgi:hypothetical protein